MKSSDMAQNHLILCHPPPAKRVAFDLQARCPDPGASDYISKPLDVNQTPLDVAGLDLSSEIVRLIGKSDQRIIKAINGELSRIFWGLA